MPEIPALRSLNLLFRVPLFVYNRMKYKGKVWLVLRRGIAADRKLMNLFGLL
jgi:hypothetical protein